MTGSIAAPGDELYRLFDEYWDHDMEINPFAATNSGISLFSDWVPDVSPAADAKGWTRQRAMDYLASNTALSLHSIGT